MHRCVVAVATLQIRTHVIGGPKRTLGLSPTHRGYSRIETVPNETLLFMLTVDAKLFALSRAPQVEFCIRLGSLVHVNKSVERNEERKLSSCVFRIRMEEDRRIFLVALLWESGCRERVSSCLDTVIFAGVLPSNIGADDPIFCGMSKSSVFLRCNATVCTSLSLWSRSFVHANLQGWRGSPVSSLRLVWNNVFSACFTGHRLCGWP